MPPKLTAYPVHPSHGWQLRPAARRRDWMDETGHANRCLPLLIANQAGWFVTCPVGFRAVWDGGSAPTATKLSFTGNPGPAKSLISPHFGHGIITFQIPWLFQTSEGYALYVHGPANYFKPNIAPLEGIVETSWLPFTFTMNWKITRPNQQVWFKPEEPVCMLTPMSIDALESVEPHFADINENTELKNAYEAWRAKRIEGRQKRLSGDDTSEYNYIKGNILDGSKAQEHRSNLKIRHFAMPGESSAEAQSREAARAESGD